ncbi:hypothetical protein GDO81_020162 [Engystomops pustulosus]|uniref:G-protein coupled receptors family 1 profile domain-containing protein n=1 Tax=Engystomops pustulosus TaxID=76066 RepID=A0AAV6ZH86_ENGPU|nr:hypothetical protein GDO81_020162 [Engystomops pustulosus]
MNETSYFYILAFSAETSSKPFITAFFFLIYVVGVLINSSIITVICLEVQLHKPMYLFICNLSIVDIFYTSVTVPKLLHMLLSGNHIVSSAQCYTQLSFFFVNLTLEDTLLFVMAYDRYVAICNPLHYHRILNWRNCSLITIGIWATAFLNSLMFVSLLINMSSCHSNVIHQFFCDLKSLTKMKTKESRKKAFSTCSSHVTVVSIYYGAGLVGYLIPPYSDVLDSVFNIIYSTIVPMINPIIYSLQNSAIQSAWLGIFRGMSFGSRYMQSVRKFTSK